MSEKATISSYGVRFVKMLMLMIKSMILMKLFPNGLMFQSDLLAKEFGRVRFRLELYDMAR